MFGKKNALLLEEAEAKNRQLQDKLDWYQRHYEKQQNYIEELYDLVSELSRQIGLLLNSVSMERLQEHPNLEDNSAFFLDVSQLFSARLKKGKNVTCYYGKDLEELQRRFQNRDFKNSEIVHLTERLPLDSLCVLLREGLWKRPLVESLMAMRGQRKLDIK